MHRKWWVSMLGYCQGISLEKRDYDRATIKNGWFVLWLGATGFVLMTACLGGFASTYLNEARGHGRLDSGLNFGTTMGPRTRLFMPPHAQPNF